jgi:hypothetical protein
MTRRVGKTLLDGVHKLVAEQPTAVAGYPATRAEHHMPSHRERRGVNRVGGACGRSVGVHPHSTQVLAHP